MSEHDPYETRTTRRRGDTQTTEPFDDGQADSGEPVSSDWRSGRVPRRSRTAQGLPSSRQELVLWLQFGGWRVLLAAVVLVGVLIAMLWLSGRPAGAPSPFARATEQVAGAGAGAPIVPRQATVTPRPTGAATTAGPATTGGGAQFRVINTGSEGLFLRQDHSTSSQVLKTLPDGTVVTIVGADFSGPDRVWKNVRDGEGAQGWVAADFLQAVQ